MPRIDAYLVSSPASIERYGKRLVNGTLRGVDGILKIPTEYSKTKQGMKTKSSFGLLLERFYYGINPPNNSAPDFPVAGVELKSTPLKRVNGGGFSAKERLVLNLINYNEESKNTFTSSVFLKKNSKIMLVAYLHEKEKAVIDYLVKIAELVSFHGFSAADRLIIEQDWQKIINKIKAGHADELSEGDTLYLGACTKAANSRASRLAPGGIRAKPRAFSFKAGFMTTLMRRLLDAEPALKSAAELKKATFESLIENKFERFIGLTVSEITEKVGQDLNPTAKDFLAMLARRMMGVKNKNIEEFEKAEVMMKTIRIGANGEPRESMSFPAFSYLDIIHEKWDESDRCFGKPSPIKRAFEKKFFFVVFRCGENPSDITSMRLEKVMFWNMPLRDLAEVKKIWTETIRRIKEGRADDLPKSTENRVSHVRPKARDGSDKIPTPHNGMQVKKCFWLNKDYIRSQIS